MSMIGRFLDPLVKKGELTLIHADGATETFGTPTEGHPNVTLRLTDNKVVRDVLLDPRLGAAEALWS